MPRMSSLTESIPFMGMEGTIITTYSLTKPSKLGVKCSPCRSIGGVQPRSSVEYNDHLCYSARREIHRFSATETHQGEAPNHFTLAAVSPEHIKGQEVWPISFQQHLHSSTKTTNTLLL